MKRLLPYIQIIIFLIIGVLVVWGVHFYIRDIKPLNAIADLHREALIRLEIRMTRAEVDEHLEMAKAHFQCTSRYFVKDYYLFTEEITELSAPIALTYYSTDDDALLARIETPESYLLKFEISDCDRLR